MEKWYNNPSKQTSESSAERKDKDMEKTLVAFFSYSGNAKKAAEQVAALSGADLFEIQPVTAYSADYQECVEEAKKELAENARPALKEQVADMAQYDRIVLGFPNWCRTCPMPVFSFLESYDLTGKKLYAFVTNGGGGCGTSTEDIKRSAKGADVTEAINGNDLTDAQIKDWLSL